MRSPMSRVRRVPFTDAQSCGFASDCQMSFAITPIPSWRTRSLCAAERHPTVHGADRGAQGRHPAAEEIVRQQYQDGSVGKIGRVEERAIGAQMLAAQVKVRCCADVLLAQKASHLFHAGAIVSVPSHLPSTQEDRCEPPPSGHRQRSESITRGLHLRPRSRSTRKSRPAAAVIPSRSQPWLGDAWALALGEPGTVDTGQRRSTCVTGIPAGAEPGPEPERDQAGSGAAEVGIRECAFRHRRSPRHVAHCGGAGIAGFTAMRGTRQRVLRVRWPGGSHWWRRIRGAWD